jgi:hypothetical protein
MSLLPVDVVPCVPYPSCVYWFPRFPRHCYVRVEPSYTHLSIEGTRRLPTWTSTSWLFVLGPSVPPAHSVDLKLALRFLGGVFQRLGTVGGVASLSLSLSLSTFDWPSFSSSFRLAYIAWGRSVRPLSGSASGRSFAAWISYSLLDLFILSAIPPSNKPIS